MLKLVCLLSFVEFFFETPFFRDIIAYFLKFTDVS